MTTVEETVEVAVPVRTAYDQWTQFKGFPRFMSVVHGVEHVRPNITHWVLGYGPVRHRFTAEIVEQHPDSVVAWRSLERRFVHRGEVSFRPGVSGGTVVTVRMEMEQGKVADLVERRTGVTRRVLRFELGHFKEFIEGLGEAGGAWRGVIHNGRVQQVEPDPPRTRVAHWPVG